MDPNFLINAAASPAAAELAVARVLQTLVALLADTVRGWDLPPDLAIDASTSLVHDLGCSSVDIIGIAVAIEEQFATRNLDFAQLLFRDNRYVEDVTVGELARFVAGKLTGAAS
jgi:acyl carrier protein